MAYVYAIIVDDVVKYIGKGSGRRAIRHVQKMHQLLRARAAGEVVRATHLHNRMAKAWRNGSSLEIVTLIDGLTDEQAFIKEVELIASYPHGQLWNQTLGGENPPRAKSRSPEFIEKVRASNVIAWSNPRLLAHHSERCKVLWLDPEYRDKTIKGNIGKGGKAKRLAAIDRWAQIEFREKIKKLNADPVTKARRSEWTKRAWITRRATVK